MERIGTTVSHNTIRFDHIADIAGFDGDRNVYEIEFFEQLCMIHSAFGKCRGNGSAVFFKNVFFERAAVNADTDRNAICFAFISDRFDFFIGTDISGVDTDLIDPRLCGGKSNLIIKMKSNIIKNEEREAFRGSR